MSHYPATQNSQISPLTKNLITHRHPITSPQSHFPRNRGIITSTPAIFSPQTLPPTHASTLCTYVSSYIRLAQHAVPSSSSSFALLLSEMTCILGYSIHISESQRLFALAIEKEQREDDFQFSNRERRRAEATVLILLRARTRALKWLNSDARLCAGVDLQYFPQLNDNWVWMRSSGFSCFVGRALRTFLMRECWVEWIGVFEYVGILCKKDPWVVL